MSEPTAQYCMTCQHDWTDAGTCNHPQCEARARLDQVLAMKQRQCNQCAHETDDRPCVLLRRALISFGGVTPEEWREIQTGQPYRCERMTPAPIERDAATVDMFGGVPA